MGSPSKTEWPEGHELANNMDFEFPRFVKTPLEEIVKGVSDEGLQLLEKMMAWNPNNRPNASECLQDSYFDSVRKYFEPHFKEKPQSYYKRKNYFINLRYI